MVDRDPQRRSSRGPGLRDTLLILTLLILTGAIALPAAGEPISDPASSAAAAASPSMEALDSAIQGVTDPLDQVEQQVEAEEYTEAIAWLEQRVAAVAAESHQFDGRLVRPLILLGDAQAGIGAYEEALGSYARALHLNRVNDGLNSPGQVEIVYREANLLKTLGRYELANDREEYAYHVLNRAHGPLDEELLPGIYHLAQWYERTNNIFAARALYERALEIVDAHDELTSETAIPALHGLATSYRMERFPPYYLPDVNQSESSVAPGLDQPPLKYTVNNFPPGESALQRIVQIRKAAQPPDLLAEAKAVLDLADWYTLFDKQSRAVPLYGHAWELLQQIEGFDVPSYFANPEQLYFPDPGDPPPPPPEDRGEPQTGYVEVAFDVTESGYVRALHTVDSQPDDLMDFRVRKSLRMARYRPMLVDGVPVDKGSYTYRHEFPYYPERQKSEEPPATAAASPSG